MMGGSQSLEIRVSRSRSAGQALVALLVFMAVALTLTAAATSVVLIGLRSTTAYSLGEEALSYAEAGVDNAMLRLIRDPAYTGETLTVSTGTATITVSGAGSSKTIVSEGVSGNAKRRIQADATLQNNTLSITSWSETP